MIAILCRVACRNSFVLSISFEGFQLKYHLVVVACYSFIARLSFFKVYEIFWIFSSSSYHFVRDLTMAPCVLSFNIILRSCFKTSFFSIVVSKSALGFCISSCKFWSLVSISLIAALILLFLLLANLIVWPLMTHLVVSHKREGFASLLVSFTFYLLYHLFNKFNIF